MATTTTTTTPPRPPPVPPPPPQVSTVSGGRGGANAFGDANSDNASSIDDHVGEKLTPTLSKRQKVRAHCGRFWLWYLIGTIIFLAIFLPILFKLIIPAIVQAIINGQGLPIQGGYVQVDTATQLYLGINTSLNTPLPARIDNTTLDLFNRKTQPFTPFANITIAGQKLKGDTKIIVPPQLVSVLNESELISWFDKVFSQDKVDLSVRGRPSVFLGAIEQTANINKDITLPGLRKFAGFGIDDLRIVLPPDKNGNNLRGTVNIPNWGVLVLNFGNITFNITSGKTQIGQITVYETNLKPGNNSLSFDGKLDLNAIIQNLGPVLQSQTEALNRGQVDLNATGVAVVMNGTRITFIETVLSGHPLTASVSVITLLSDVINGFVGGGSASIVNVLGDVVGNSTFLQHVIGHYNATQVAKNQTQSSFTKRAPDPKDALMWNMLKMGLRMKLNQAGR